MAHSCRLAPSAGESAEPDRRALGVIVKYVFFGNNAAALRVLSWLMDQGDPPAALVVHPAERAKCRGELIEVSRLDAARVLDGDSLQTPPTMSALRAVNADCGLSVFFDYKLPPAILALFPRECFNLHPSLLPFNRGQYPNVWSIVERTPAGVTLHYMDGGFDTGDIVSQRPVTVLPTDTGESLYHRLEDACVTLFQETWPAITRGEVSRVAQSRAEGTTHRTRDVDDIDRIELDRVYTARHLIDVLRARTFPPYRGAYVVHEGRRIYLRISLEAE